MPRFLASFRSVFIFLAVVLTLGAAESPARKRMAIVIDDGPVPAHNAKLLELLAREHVRVTFSRSEEHTSELSHG